jgi:REP element-mobilizing transposase RayT
MPLDKHHTGWTDRGFLPHLDQAGLIQSVTFRLADSMPQNRRDEWEQLLFLENESERIRQIEAWLDKGAGSCVLRDPACAKVVQDALRHFDEQRYRLVSWCVMPNHVHVMFEVFEGHTLGTLIHSWKTFTTREINKHLGRTGSLWQEDYFDRFIRDGTHLENEARYIEGNPIAAGFVQRAEDWPFSSAHHRE